MSRSRLEGRKQFTGKHWNPCSSFISYTQTNYLAQEKVRSFKETVSFRLASNHSNFLNQMYFHIFYIPALPAGHLTSPIMPVGIAVKSGPEYWPITARVIHLIEKRCCVKSIHYTMNDTTQRFSGKRENLILFSGTVKIILTRDTQIYSKTFLGMKISWTSIHGTE